MSEKKYRLMADKGAKKPFFETDSINEARKALEDRPLAYIQYSKEAVSMERMFRQALDKKYNVSYNCNDYNNTTRVVRSR